MQGPSCRLCLGLGNLNSRCACPFAPCEQQESRDYQKDDRSGHCTINKRFQHANLGFGRRQIAFKPSERRGSFVCFRSYDILNFSFGDRGIDACLLTLHGRIRLHGRRFGIHAGRLGGVGLRNFGWRGLCCCRGHRGRGRYCGRVGRQEPDMTAIVAVNTGRPDIAGSAAEAVDWKPQLRRSPQVPEIVDEQPFARAFSGGEDRDRVGIQLCQLNLAPHRNDRSLDSLTRGQPHLASALTELARKLLDRIWNLVPIEAPWSDIAIDINRLAVSAVQSGAGCFERATAPVLLSLRSLASRKFRKLFTRAALIATICWTLGVDPSP